MSDLDRLSVRRSFERAADGYDTTAVLQQEIGARLLSRLEYIKLQPEAVLDLGAGTGLLSKALQDRYKKSRVVALDFALPMLKKVRRHRVGLLRKLDCICADAVRLPFADASFDLVFSNLMLQWCQPAEDYFREIRRVLRPDGLFMLTSFGPDTLKELRQAWSEVDEGIHVHGFTDMHDLGDALLQTGFAEPVMDMEVLTATYPDLVSLLRDIKGVGASYASIDRSRGLMGKSRYLAFEQAYEQFRDATEKLPATYEVVYGQAWIPPVQPSAIPERFVEIKALNSE